MDEEMGEPSSREAAGSDDGTNAVLYAMFTSFTEALAGLEERLAGIEAAVRAGPSEVQLRLGRVEEALDALSQVVRAQTGSGAGPASAAGAGGDTTLADLVDRQSQLLDQRTAALAADVHAVRALLQAHAEETSNSLGRRAGEAGRRLASDLGLRGRPKRPAPPA